MKKIVLLITILVQGTLLFAQTNVPKKYPEIDIPYRKFVLKNGLRLIVHEDHKAPIASFNVWYHVGSKNEKPGKTGFAHLFEHLMFEGSEHHNDGYFKVMDALGATDLNGTTNNDRTNYFENFPVSALDKVLWIESDRMGFMVNVIDSAKLNQQRGVVQNEKRLGENQPYAVADELTAKGTYPSNHPYSWTVIGAMEDLDAASIKDVKDWFKSYYGPNNAVICIAGDVIADSIYNKVNKYFGDLPAVPPIARPAAWTAKMTGVHMAVAQDRVPQARLQKTWNVPAWGTREMTYLNLLGDILATGKTSRLYKKLVYDDQIASNIYFYTDEKEIGGQFYIIADAKPGISLDSLDHTISRELVKVFKQGVTIEELERAKTNYFSGFIKGMERIGGFGGKSDILAQNETFGNDADHYKVVQNWIKNAQPADIKNIAYEWLTDGEFKLKIYPYGDYATTPTVIDRKLQPALSSSPAVKFPEVKEFTLSNGLKVSLVTRIAVPVVEMSLVIDAGYAADKFGVPGLASMTIKMMKEGTKTRNSLQIDDQLADLGASFYTYSSLDRSFLYLSALKVNFNSSLNVFSDVLLNPVFPQKDFDRVQKRQLLAIKQEQSQPVTMGLRILPRLIYGNGHAYSNSYTGTGTEASVSQMKRADLEKFYDTWFAPNNAILFVVGDIKEAELKAALESKLASWKTKTIPKKNIATVEPPAKPTIYIVDKPGALQSIIFAAEVSQSATDPDYKSNNMMNRILGGDFTSRINMNLREDKHWAYGAFSILLDAQGQGFFTGYAPVQTDKTKESIVEMMKEFKAIISKKPITEAEFKKVQGSAVLELPGIWETNGAVLNDLQSAIIYNRGLGYLNTYADMLQHLTMDNLQKSAMKIVQPDHLTWVIVGDRSKIEQGIRDLNIGTLQIIDSEGNSVK
ncbi:MAG: peptidase [Mucilaginibacter sp.]|nr:peptidase [Mucilaginibacter sp.]